MMGGGAGLTRRLQTSADKSAATATGKRQLGLHRRWNRRKFRAGRWRVVRGTVGVFKVERMNGAAGLMMWGGLRYQRCISVEMIISLRIVMTKRVRSEYR